MPVAYHLNLREPAALFAARRFPIRDKDILYVSNAPFSDISKLMQLVGTVGQPAIQGVAVTRILYDRHKACCAFETENADALQLLNFG